MSKLLQFIYIIFPCLSAIALMLMIYKAILVAQQKGFSLSQTMWSFMHIYDTKAKKMATSRKRLKFMKKNNFINYYIYFWLIFCLFCASVYLITYRKDDNLAIFFF